MSGKKQQYHINKCTATGRVNTSDSFLSRSPGVISLTYVFHSVSCKINFWNLYHFSPFCILCIPHCRTL